MNDSNFILFILGFFAGYFIKTFFNFRSSYESGSVLVQRVADQCLILLGSVVYKMSYMDQIYRKSIASVKGAEAAKICDNELSYEFEKWKKQTMETFVQEYPEEYRWQLEATDWQSAMRCLTDIYTKEKFENGKAEEHNN